MKVAPVTSVTMETSTADPLSTPALTGEPTGSTSAPSPGQTGKRKALGQPPSSTEIRMTRSASLRQKENKKNIELAHHKDKSKQVVREEVSSKAATGAGSSELRYAAVAFSCLSFVYTIRYSSIPDGPRQTTGIAATCPISLGVREAYRELYREIHRSFACQAT
jgi:hypothetical protein